MIIKSTKRDPFISKTTYALKSVKVKRSLSDDRRYILTNSIHDNKNLIILFDIISQRIIYKIASTKEVDELYEEVFSIYKRKNIRVVSPENLKFLLEEAKSGMFISSSQAFDITTTQKQISIPKKEYSAHIQSIIDTYRFIDKYRVNLFLESLSVEGGNQTLINLFDEENGIDKGIHKLVYNHVPRNYKYFYMGELIKETVVLEDIFK